MDVIHVPSFGKLNMFMSLGTLTHGSFFCPLSGESVKDVITVLVRAFATLGPCNIVKTDNAPAYTARPFQEF